MIVTIPLATGNKLNYFTTAKEMLSIILHCALVLLLFLFLYANTNKSSSPIKCFSLQDNDINEIS